MQSAIMPDIFETIRQELNFDPFIKVEAWKNIMERINAK